MTICRVLATVFNFVCGLAQVWTMIKENEKRHLQMLKEELAKEVAEGRLK